MQVINAKSGFYFVGIFILLSVSGCDFVRSFSNNGQPPPEWAVNELMMYGVTMSPKQGGNRFPRNEDINVRLESGATGEPYVVFKRFQLAFSPEENHTKYENYTDLLTGFSRHYPYQYFFVDRNDGMRVVIPGNELEINDFTNIDYVGKVSPKDFPSQFLMGGDHYLGAVHAGIPVRATHVELWFRETLDSPAKLVVDMEIDKLTGWKTYIEPLIPEQ